MNAVLSQCIAHAVHSATADTTTSTPQQATYADKCGSQHHVTAKVIVQRLEIRLKSDRGLIDAVLVRVSGAGTGRVCSSFRNHVVQIL